MDVTTLKALFPDDDFIYNQTSLEVAEDVGEYFKGVEIPKELYLVLATEYMSRIVEAFIEYSDIPDYSTLEDRVECFFKILNLTIAPALLVKCELWYYNKYRS